MDELTTTPATGQITTRRAAASPVAVPRVGTPPLIAPAPRLLVPVALAAVYVAWGSTYLAIRVMVDEMPSLLGSGTRALAAAALLAAGVAAWRGTDGLRVSRRQLAGCAVVGLLLSVAGQGLVTVAEDRGAPSGLTALLVAGVPLWVTCLRALSGDRPSRRSVVGVGVGFLGVLGLVVGAGGTGGPPTGALLLVLAASAAWAFGTWLQPRLALPEDPFVLVVYELLVGGAVLSLLGLLDGQRPASVAYSRDAWLAWAYLVVVGSVLALTAYNWLLRTTKVTVVATYAYVNPAVALLLGWLVLSEPITEVTLAGAAVVVVGVVLVLGAEWEDARQTEGGAGRQVHPSTRPLGESRGGAR